MATQPWKFLINSFYVQTVDTLKNALSLTNDHVAKLTANEADAEILAIKTTYLPLHTGFLTAQNQLDSKLGIYHGQTQTFEELLEELAFTKINQWRGTVFAIFPEGTADAKAIFPRDREPFQRDTYDQIVEAVETLSITLATYTAQAALVSLSATVHTYHLTLTGARALQQTDEGSVVTLRTNLKTAHSIMCTGLYRNLGSLMAKYASTPETVANYFDLTLLRNTGVNEDGGVTFPFIWQGNLSMGNRSSLELANLGLDAHPSVTFTFENTSATLWRFYAPPAAGDGPGAILLDVFPGTTVVKTLAELVILLGISEINHNLNVQNVGAVPGNFKVTIAEP